MGLRFDPMGGGQFKLAIQKIMQMESKPLLQMQQDKGKIEARLKLFEQFKNKFNGLDGSISAISNLRTFREFKVDLGQGKGLVDVTVDKNVAQPGTYKLQVNHLAARTSVISNGFSDPNKANLGMGYIVMKLTNGQTKDVFIDDNKASLRGIERAINNEADCPVRAAVIKDVSNPDAPWKLILSAKKDGAANQIDIPDFYFMDGDKDLNLDDERDAKNAQIKMDGFPIETESNDVKDFLPGVNLHLKQADPHKPFTLTITEDTKKMTGKVKHLIDQINGILGFITQQNTVDQHTDTSTMFTGDTTLTDIEYRLRNLLQEAFPAGSKEKGNFRWIHLNDLGVEFDKHGQLQFNSNKFQKELENDYKGVGEAISGPHGFAYQLQATIDSYTEYGTGTLAVREQGIRERIKNIDDEIDQTERRLQAKQKSLTMKFARLEGTMANMQRQQQALGALGAPASGGGSLVQQLLGG